MPEDVNPAQNIFIKRLNLGGTGPTVAVKDTIDIAGEPTMAGSRALEGALPAERHADVVERILSQGCRIIGKANLHELAFGTTGINDWTKTPINPRFPEFVPGGSSSGSAAAVAAGLADFSIGTDTGGSIRIPAACCGVFGLKPTFGRISRRGVMPPQSSIDCVGPLAASAAGLVRAMIIMDPTFAAAHLKSLRIGFVETSAEATIAAAVLSAAQKSGFPVRSVELLQMQAAYEAGLTIINAENWTALSSIVATGKVGEDVASRLRQAALTTQDDVAAAEQVRQRFQDEVDGRLREVDVLVLPTLSHQPPRLSTARTDPTAVRMTTLVRPFNLSGHPAASVPLSPKEGTPIALQVIGRRGEDAVVLNAVEMIANSL